MTGSWSDDWEVVLEELRGGCYLRVMAGGTVWMFGDHITATSMYVFEEMSKRKLILLDPSKSEDGVRMYIAVIEKKETRA